jgi:hypothetical protein
MANIPHCAAGGTHSKTDRYPGVLLILFVGFLLCQGCKLDAPIIPDSLLHPHTDTTKTDTVPDVTPPADTIITDTITPATANFSQLTAWKAYRANPSSRYDMLLIGDSYTQGNFYSWRLRGKLLSDGFLDGGPGYDSFGRWDPVGMYSIDGSMDPAELTFTYDPLLWDTSPGDYFGPCGNVTNNAPNATITVSARVLLNSFTIIFQRHPNAGNFRYRINGGNWTTVSAANATADIGNVLINVTDAGDNIDLDIEPLQAGQVFCGVLARRDGDVLNLHKVGSSGTTADFFAHNLLWEKSIELLTPKGAIIMFGTNEMDANVEPAQMRMNIQHIIDQLRQAQPNCDIIIMCPPETLYENEDPRKYKIANYADMLFRLALKNHAAFIDLAKVFGPFSQASINSDLMSTDRKHPGDVGSELIAQTIFNGLK